MSGPSTRRQKIEVSVLDGYMVPRGLVEGGRLLREDLHAVRTRIVPAAFGAWAVGSDARKRFLSDFLSEKRCTREFNLHPYSHSLPLRGEMVVVGQRAF